MQFLPVGLTFVMALSCVSAFTSDYFFHICNAIVISNPAFDSCTHGATTPSKLTVKENICLYRDIDYLVSIYLCVSRAGSIAKVESAARQSWNALDAACRKYTDYGLIFSFDQMPAVMSMRKLSSYDEAKENGKGAFECSNSTLTSKVIKSGLAYRTNIYASNVYGGATIAYVGGIILLQILLRLLKWHAPLLYREVANSRFGRMFRKHFTIPALFGTSRATPVSLSLKFIHWDFCFPPRVHSFLIMGYSILSFILLFIRYDFVTTEFTFTTQIEAITKLIGYRSGYFAMYKLPILVLFASKNNVLMWATGWGYDVFNHWHRALGRLFLLDIIIHAACYSRWGQWAGVYAVKWTNFPPWIAAQSATIATGLICLISNKTLRSKIYDVFRAIHIILAIIVLVGVYVHISYFQLALEPLYVTVGIWIFDRVMRLVRIIWSGIFARAEISEECDEILKVNLLHGNRWQAKGGSYVFVHFLHGVGLMTPHPFTVVRGSDDPFSSQLFIKARCGRTRQILEMVRKENGYMELPVWIDGPYGHDFDKAPFREVVLYAGGVGITGVYSHLESVCRNDYDQNFYVYWTVPNMSWLITFHELITKMQSDPRVLLMIYVTRGDALEKEKLFDAEIYFCRPNITEITASHIEDSIASTCFFVCGPAPMCDNVRAAVAANLKRTKNYVEFNEECFSM